MSQSLDVAVVGGGVIGLACAWSASRRGLRVGVFECATVRGAATPVAAGMLAPVTEAAATERPLLELGLESARRWPAFAAELAKAAGGDVGLRRSGTLLVARDADDAAGLERELELREALGLRVERLRPSQARAREPSLAPTVRLAMDAPDDHSVDPQRLRAALQEAVAGAGVEVQAGDGVGEVRCSDGRVDGLTLGDGRRVDARRVVLAAGAWSSALAGVPAHAMVPVRPVKGQVLRLRDPAGAGLCGHILRTEHAYLVPRDDGAYVLGATMEERGFDLTVTAGAVHELLRDIGEVLPGLSELTLEGCDVGLRPTTPDNAPVIGPAPGVEGLVWATGHHRNGILLAPITGELVADALTGQPSSEFAAAFAPSRFARSGSLA